MVDDNNLYIDKIYEYDRHFSNITFTYQSIGDELLMLPLTYYLGYKGTVSGCVNEINIDIIDVDIYHKVGLKTLEGLCTYSVQYKGTNIQFISLIISLISLMGLLVYIFKNKKTH